MLDIEKLLAPVSTEAPCGEAIAFSADMDAIAAARKADDPSIEQGAWVTTLKEADWKFVASRCAQLIENRSKDLQLAVWLAEALAKTAGPRGLADGLLVVAALCERYWDHVHPLPDEGGFEQRIGNLCWIGARAPQLIMEMAVTEGASAFSLRDIEAARARGPDALADIDAAKRRSSRAFYENLMRDCDHCAAALGDLERTVDDRLGADGPGFTQAKSALQELIHFVAPMAREGGAAAETLAAQQAAPAGGVAATGMPIASGPIQTRSQALAQLRAVAAFFRSTEPHSPVAYLADKAANWGEQPLHVWLRAVVKDDSSFAHLEELLGISEPPR
jgi:type VI secretion system protein ImpA